MHLKYKLLRPIELSHIWGTHNVKFDKAIVATSAKVFGTTDQVPRDAWSLGTQRMRI